MSAFEIWARVFDLTVTWMAFYVAAINVLYLFLMVLGFFALWRERRTMPREQQDALLRSPMLPAVAVLAPAFNEAATCRESVRAMLALHYPNHEVIVRAIYESRDPIRLVVIDKENGGKADSLNAGINVARAPLVCAVDSDSLLEDRALLWVIQPFLEDESTVAAIVEPVT